MHSGRFTRAGIFVFLSITALAGCGGASGSSKNAPAQATSSGSSPTTVAISTHRSTVAATITRRTTFAGAFFRPEGAPPYGVILPQSSQIAPQPYPQNATPQTGSSGYCDETAANGASIDGSYQVDTNKLNDVIFLGARWTRMPVSQFFVDTSHIFGEGQYQFGTLDAAQCISYVFHQLKPVIGLEAGPVQYNSSPGVFSPASIPTYKTAADFGQWCGVVAAHETKYFPGVNQYSLPGNEVNNNPQLFPGGEQQIAEYSKACYTAIKAASPSSYVYGFELSMDGYLNAPAFVRRMVALGCGVGSCYDGIAMHLSLRWPILPAGTPCYPNPGGDYTMQCVTDVENASGSPIHVLISETVYTVPSSVPDEWSKAFAVTDEFAAYAANPTIDGVLYSNVDECAVYPTGFFSGGCLIDTSGNHLPAWSELQWEISQNLI